MKWYWWAGAGLVAFVVVRQMMTPKVATFDPRTIARFNLATIAENVI